MNSPTADLNAKNSPQTLTAVRCSELVSLRQTLSWINQSLRHPRMDYHQQMMEILQRLSTINTPELRESLGEAIESLKQANDQAEARRT